jgi:hypothetical protein
LPFGGENRSPDLILGIFSPGAEAERSGSLAGRPAQAVWPAPNRKKSTPDHKNIDCPDDPKILI